MVLVGAFVMLWQTVMVDVPSPILVPAAVTLLLGPAGMALLSQRNNGGPSTTEPSSSEPPSPSSQSSSSPPS